MDFSLLMPNTQDGIKRERKGQTEPDRGKSSTLLDGSALTTPIYEITTVVFACAGSGR